MTAQKGSSGMGMRKHGKTGWKNGPGQSPRFRLAARIEAEKNERKAPPPLPHTSVAELFRKR